MVTFYRSLTAVRCFLLFLFITAFYENANDANASVPRVGHPFGSALQHIRIILFAIHTAPS